jgi:hypothetical protein
VSVHLFLSSTPVATVTVKAGVDPRVRTLDVATSTAILLQIRGVALRD